MQVSPPQSPTPPASPTVIVTGPAGTQPITLAPPRTARDIDAIKARRDELSSQLNSVDSRRLKLLGQLRQTGDPAAVKGLEARLSLLDARQLQLESEIQQTGQQLTSAAAGVIATTSDARSFGGFSNKEVMGLSVLSILFIFFPLAAGLSKAMWRRSNRPGIAPAALTESAQRLERLESSVDAIAIEVERISEGQRFVTKLLSDGQAAPLVGPGQRSPEPIPARK